ncbi:MAG: acetylglutamate kinase [Balneola sp.]
MKDSIKVIKIGGTIAEDENQLDDFLKDFAALKGFKILIHGGGVIATKLAEKLGLKLKMIDGRRVTDKGMLDIATMVYAGLVNKKIVAALQAIQVNAVGLTGADLNLIQAAKRNPVPIDFGWVGDIASIKTNWIRAFLEKGVVPVFAPITHDGKGSLLNTNADSVASELAVKLAEKNEVELILCFDQPGVMRDGKVITSLKPDSFEKLKQDKVISGGMIPKLQMGFKAIEKGVHHVVLKSANDLNEEQKGTRLEV